MRIWMVIAVLGWSVMLSPVAAGGGAETMQRTISLPSDTLQWKWDGKVTAYDSRTLFQYINGAAELYLAYGFEHLVVRRLEKEGKPPIIVELYAMASAEDAYGVFSFEHQDEPAGIGQDSEFGGSLLRFWKGNYFVSVYGEGEGSEMEEAILSTGRATANAIPTTGARPTLARSLPGKEFGYVERSTRYLKSHILLNQRFFLSHQNILNVSRKTEAVLASYLQDKRKTHLLAVRYPSPREADAALQSFMKAYMPEAASKGRLRTEDRLWTVVRQKRDLLLIVFGASSEAHAEKLLAAAEKNIDMLSGKDEGK